MLNPKYCSYPSNIDQVERGERPSVKYNQETLRGIGICNEDALNIVAIHNGKHGNVVLTTLEPIMNYKCKTIKHIILLNLHPYPIYNQMFDLCDIVVGSYKCTNHAWHLGFHTHMYDKCERFNCGVTFDPQW
jgi:hypothetical protein